MDHDITASSVGGITCSSELSDNLRRMQEMGISTVQRRHMYADTGMCRLTGDDQQQLSTVIERGWRNCLFMGPLWGVQLSSREQLQLFKQALRAELASHEELGGSGVTVELEPVDCLTDTSLNISSAQMVPSLLITVAAGGHTAQLLFCSDCENGARFLPADCEPYSWFSVVLTRGHALTVNVLVESLRLVYGGSYVDAGFTQDQMRWLVAMWTQEPRRKRGRSRDRNSHDTSVCDRGATVTLTWSVPSHVATPAMKMRTVFTFIDMTTKWRRIRPVESAVLSREDMYKFHQQLREQLVRDTGLPVNKLVLDQLETPSVVFRSSGSVRFGNIEVVSRCIRLFREFSREFFFGKI